ncbi:MAG: RdgB/HAM1 family non-canonical purine NTP pyrophosphatase [Ignavibacteriales bacterium]|nr:RdgB/HAM1 family non-canonical purine NTP pyrophosphatase [Ignavibacteriales bacterium]
MHKLILATRNPGKVKEITDLLSGMPLQVESLINLKGLPDVVENGATLEENALLKARTIFNITKTPTVADDTGLEVDSLNMAPGVISARYAGENVSYEENNRKLLRELEGIPVEKRTAQFRCIAVYKDKETEKIVEGICRGKIINELRGTEGFGYDPLFIPEGYNKTYAQLTLAEKNVISHRAKAFQQMKLFLQNYYLHD